MSYSIVAIATDPEKPKDYDSFLMDLVLSPGVKPELMLTHVVDNARRFSTPQEAAAFVTMTSGTNPDGSPHIPLSELPILIVTKDGDA